MQNDDIEQSQLGVYLQDEIQWQNLTVVAGLRHDDFESENKQIKSGSSSTLINEAQDTSGRVAAIYDLGNGVSPYLSYSQSFQPTVGSNFITNEPFEATTAEQTEIGVKYLSNNRNTQATLALYDITQQNVVVSDYVSYRNQTQTGEIESNGFEVSGSQRVNDWIDVTASYSYTDAEITKDEVHLNYVGNAPEQMAKHKATLWADFYPTDNIKLNAGLCYQAGMQIDRLNSDELPSVTVMDIGGSYRVNDRCRIDTSVSNLFDKTYVGTCYKKENCWMGPERQMSVTTEF